MFLTETELIHQTNNYTSIITEKKTSIEGCRDKFEIIRWRRAVVITEQEECIIVILFIKCSHYVDLTEVEDRFEWKCLVSSITKCLHKLAWGSISWNWSMWGNKGDPFIPFLKSYSFSENEKQMQNKINLCFFFFSPGITLSEFRNFYLSGRG